MSAPDLTVDDLGIPPESTCLLDPDQVGRVAATLDTDRPVDGDELPLLWHWTFFTLSAATSKLGPDGHPRLDPDGPTADLPSRMWAGGRLKSPQPLIVGRPTTRRSIVARTKRTTGRSGDLLVVTVGHQYEQDGDVCLVEEQDLLYRAGGGTVDRPVGAHVEPAPAGGWTQGLTVDSPLLFRYSALTFNSHRIHYDEAYARDVEGYPGLVVHGPLTATLLALAATRATGRDLQELHFRATAPLFASVPFTVVGSADGDAVESKAVRNDGAGAMSAEMKLR